jgi:hypothetical protein
MNSVAPRRVAAATVKGLSAFGYVVAATLFCTACSGLPILAGVLGVLGIGARLGLSAGVVSAVVLTYSFVPRKRRRRGRACAVPPAAARPRIE